MKKFDNIRPHPGKIISSLKCDYAEIRFSSGAGTSILFSGKTVDSVKSGGSSGGSVRVLKNGAWGFVSFNDISVMESSARRCLEMASMIHAGPGERSAIKPAGPLTGSYSDTMAEDFTSIPFDEKFSLIRGYNELLNSSSLIQTTSAMYRDVKSSYYYFNSEGSELKYDKCYCGVSLSSVARDGSVIQPFHNSVSGHGGFEIARNRGEMAQDIARMATDLLKAESLPGGRYSVIVNQKLAGVFIHEAFGHLSEADGIHENDDMKKIMVLGRRFGPDNLNVIDDGTLAGLSGFIPFDDNGVLPGKTYLIGNGLLSGRLHSRETAGKMGEEPTGNARAISAMSTPIVRMTNTYIENGVNTRKDLFDSMDSGIYALDYIGGQTNLEMFTFTSGYGYGIKNGKKGKLYRDIVLSGNVFNTLMNISMLADDRAMFGGLGGCGKGGQSPLPVSFGGPHMLINDVLIGGSQ